MCGIVAGSSLGLNIDNINQAIAILANRGPDWKNLWTNEHNFIGHTLLSLFSASVDKAIQPIYSYTKNLVGCVNGEVYNYPALREKLEKIGCNFYTNSDAEVLINGIDQFGTKFLNEINGEFAFVVFNILEKEWIAGVDRFGTKPLKYYLDHNKFFIASNANTLQELGINLTLDVDSCLHSLALQVLDKNRTIYKNIKNIPPGHYIKISNNFNFFTEKYVLPTKASTDEVDINHVESLIIDAIRYRIPKYDPLAIVLSGGIDSGSIAHYLNCDQIKFASYSVDFIKSFLSERESITEFCSKEKFHTNIIDVTEDILIGNFYEAVCNSENFAINPHVAAKLAVNKQMGIDLYKVCLTGDGADELFYGYDHFHTGDEFEVIKKSIILGEKNLSLLDDRNTNVFIDALNFNNTYKTSQDFYIDHWLQQYGVGMLGDSQSASLGQEHRYPYLDLYLHEYLQSIRNFKGLNSPSKNVLRKVVSKWNNQLALMPKKPFATPYITAEWLPVIKKYVLTEKFFDVGIYDREKLHEYIALLESGKSYSTVIFCQMLSLAILVDKFVY